MVYVCDVCGVYVEYVFGICGPCALCECGNLSNDVFGMCFCVQSV